MITHGKKWHYLALKSKPAIDGYNHPIRSLSRLLRGISSNHVGDYYRLNCFHSKAQIMRLRNTKDCAVITITVI